MKEKDSKKEITFSPEPQKAKTTVEETKEEETIFDQAAASEEIVDLQAPDTPTTDDKIYQEDMPHEPDTEIRSPDDFMQGQMDTAADQFQTGNSELPDTTDSSASERSTDADGDGTPNPNDSDMTGQVQPDIPETTAETGTDTQTPEELPSDTDPDSLGDSESAAVPDVAQVTIGDTVYDVSEQGIFDHDTGEEIEYSQAPEDVQEMYDQVANDTQESLNDISQPEEPAQDVEQPEADNATADTRPEDTMPETEFDNSAVPESQQENPDFQQNNTEDDQDNTRDAIPDNTSERLSDLSATLEGLSEALGLDDKGESDSADSGQSGN